MKKLPVRVGCGTLDQLMSKAQCLRYGNKAMPSRLKMAGFETSIFEGDLEMNGSEFYRINYTKRC